jgi:hypothetical protein
VPCSSRHCFRCLQEDFSFDATQNELKLESWLGPLHFAFAGTYRVSGPHTISFSFDCAAVDLAGKQLVERPLYGKSKTYDYILARDGIVLSRSSAGGLTMQMAVSKLRRPERKIDFLATRL